MSLRERFRRVPPSLSGRSRHEVFIGLVDATVSGVWRVTGCIRQVADPRQLDRTLALTVADRRVVARDQHVVALTLTAADGGPLEPWRAGSSGATLRVGADDTLLSALRRAEVAAPYSCRQGFCGTCRTRVLDGEVEHRDTLLTAPERAGGVMLTCVSRAAPGGRLTLEL